MRPLTPRSLPLTSALSPWGEGTERLLFFLLLVLIPLSGCGSDNTGNTIVVYSPHGKHLEGDIKQRFEATHAGYKVHFLDMSGGDILIRVQGEKSSPKADLWWGGSPMDFNRAAREGLLETCVPEWAHNLPSDARHPDGAWVATFRTPEVIMYNSKKLPAGDVPKTWDDLLLPKFKGHIVIRDVRASATMKTIFGALIVREQRRTGNLEDGFKFLAMLDASTGSYAANPEVLTRLLESDTPYSLTLWNLADALLLKSHGHPFEYVIPQGTPVPVEPIAIIKNGANVKGARLLYDFINDPEQLLLMAKERHRMPARTDLPRAKLPEWMQNLQLEAMPLDWDMLSKNIDEWMARWDSQIKGQSRG